MDLKIQFHCSVDLKDRKKVLQITLLSDFSCKDIRTLKDMILGFYYIAVYKLITTPRQLQYIML